MRAKHDNFRKTGRSLLALGIYLGMTFSVYAQDDHLWPLEYETVVEKNPEWFLLRGKTKAQYVCSPSWGNPAFGFYLDTLAGKNYLISWQKEKQGIVNKRIPISRAFAGNIESLFLTACRQIDYPEYVCFGVDYYHFYFSTVDEKGRLLAGWCWRTTPVPLNSKLIEVCDSLCHLPENGEAQQQMSREMKLLQQRIERYALKWKSHHKVYKTFGAGIVQVNNKSYKREWDEAARFPGMNPTDYVLENMVYPAEMLEKNAWVMALAIVSLDEMGYITKIYVSGGTEYSCAVREEVTRVIYSMPPWIPAKKAGLPVSSVYRFVVPFNPVAYRKRKGLE